jgi:trk system potassium uptake protein
MKFNIVIIGAGEVGFNLAKSLSKEEHDITVIDIDPHKCQKVRNNIDARVIEGDGCSQRIIQEIEMREVDYLISLTKIDEVNLVASKIGKERGAKKVICRLRNTEYGKNTIIDPSQFGINHIVFPEKAARDEIKKIITQPTSFDIETFKDEKITLTGILLDASSPLIGRTMENVEISNPYIPHKLSIICRGDITFIPTPKTKYAINDIAYFAVPSNYLDQVQSMAGKSSFKVKNIMIMGGGKIGRLVAASLQDDYNVKLLEKDLEKAELISDKLENTLVLTDDGLDIDFLESENVSSLDCFIALTENEQINIMSSLLMKHYGVKQVIVHINSTSFFKVVRRIGIDAVISKNTSAVNKVLKIIRSDEDKLLVSRFDEIEIESVEITVKENSDFLLKNLSIKDFPEEICLAAIVRKNKIIIPIRNTDLKIGDELLFFTKSEDIHKAEQLF